MSEHLWAIWAETPRGTTMAVSAHDTEEQADQEKIRCAQKYPQWAFYVTPATKE